jgi:hypothetical protein
LWALDLNVAFLVPLSPLKKFTKKLEIYTYFVFYVYLKGTWQRGRFSGVFAEIGSA